MVDKRKRKTKPKGAPSRTRWIFIVVVVLAASGFLIYALYTPPTNDAATLQKVQSHQTTTATPSFSTQTRDLLNERDSVGANGVGHSGTVRGSLPPQRTDD